MTGRRVGVKTQTGLERCQVLAARGGLNPDSSISCLYGGFWNRPGIYGLLGSLCGWQILKVASLCYFMPSKMSYPTSAGFCFLKCFCLFALLTDILCTDYLLLLWLMMFKSQKLDRGVFFLAIDGRSTGVILDDALNWWCSSQVYFCVYLGCCRREKTNPKLADAQPRICIEYIVC